MTPTESVRARLVTVMAAQCSCCGADTGAAKVNQAEVTRGAGLRSRHVVRRFLRGDTIMTSNLDAISSWMDTIDGRE